MPPVRVFSKAEVTSVLNSMGYQLITEGDEILSYAHSGRPDAPVTLDFRWGEIPEFLLFPYLEQQGVDVRAFGDGLLDLSR